MIDILSQADGVALVVLFGLITIEFVLMCFHAISNLLRRSQCKRMQAIQERI